MEQKGSNGPTAGGQCNRNGTGWHQHQNQNQNHHQTRGGGRDGKRHLTLDRCVGCSTPRCTTAEMEPWGGGGLGTGHWNRTELHCQAGVG